MSHASSRKVVGTRTSETLRVSPPPATLAELMAGDHWLAGIARELVEIVGSVEALENLNAEPLPALAADFSDCDPADADLGHDLLARIQAADLQLDAEMTTITQRIVGQLLVHPDRPLHRKAKTQRIAAAIAWVAMKANGQLGRRTRWFAADLWFAFGVSNASD